MFSSTEGWGSLVTPNGLVSFSERVFLCATQWVGVGTLSTVTCVLCACDLCMCGNHAFAKCFYLSSFSSPSAEARPKQP